MSEQKIQIDQVDVGRRRRKLVDKAVDGLADSMATVGLMEPIGVVAAGERYTLVFGHHRLEAARRLGWTEIPSVDLGLSGINVELAEIDENLVRRELTPLERSEHVAERKRLYLELHPEAKQGGAPGVAGGGKTKNAGAASFAEDTAEKTGRSKRAIQEDAQIGERLPEDVRDVLRETPVAASKTDLMAMARLSEEAQRQVLEQADLSSKESVREAIAAQGSAPEPELDDEEEEVEEEPGIEPEPAWQPTPEEEPEQESVPEPRAERTDVRKQPHRPVIGEVAPAAPNRKRSDADGNPLIVVALSVEAFAMTIESSFTLLQKQELRLLLDADIRAAERRTRMMQGVG